MSKNTDWRSAVIAAAVMLPVALAAHAASAASPTLYYGSNTNVYNAGGAHTLGNINALTTLLTVNVPVAGTYLISTQVDYGFFSQANDTGGYQNPAFFCYVPNTPSSLSSTITVTDPGTLTGIPLLNYVASNVLTMTGVATLKANTNLSLICGNGWGTGQGSSYTGAILNNPTLSALPVVMKP